MLFLKSFLAFLLLPGIVAGLVPWLLAPEGSIRPFGWGWSVLLIGLGILLWCVRDFYVAGKGTLAPWLPPEKLVTVGLYRYTRNPMYVGVLVMVLGWSLLTSYWLMTAYWLVLMAAFHLRVLYYEEPQMRKRFPEEWREYSARVPRWVKI